MVTTLLARTTDLRFERHGFRFHQLTASRWRITNAAGAIVGYLEDSEQGARAAEVGWMSRSDRWAISRMTADRRGFFVLGWFASSDEAIDALKWM